MHSGLRKYGRQNNIFLAVIVLFKFIYGESEQDWINIVK
jgi:hypothetical protein